MDVAHFADKLTAIALVTTVALLCGLMLIRLRQPAIVGYILAGIVLGPTGFRMVGNTETVQILAELGVIMLLFLIGMELNIRSFKSVMKTALSAAALQIVMAFAAFYAIGQVFEWSIERITVFAFATALSSTAVSIKILEETDDLKTPVGRTTVSVLVAQDLAVIPMLLIIGAIGGAKAGTGDDGNAGIAVLLKLALSVGLLIAVSWFLGRRDKVTLPYSDWIMSRSEIVPLAAMTFCFTWATFSGAIGLSTAYGAFIAGLIVGNSSMRVALHRAIEPVQAILLMVFFLSIGLLIDLDYIIGNWESVLTVLAIVTVLKTVVNVVILHILGEPWHRAFHSGVVMGQMGEFSFVILAAGVTAGAISSNEGYRLMIAVIALSLLISPMWLAIARKLHDLAILKLGSSIAGTPADEA